MLIVDMPLVRRWIGTLGLKHTARQLAASIRNGGCHYQQQRDCRARYHLNFEHIHSSCTGLGRGAITSLKPETSAHY
jgi:hypothetical protein